MPMLLGEIIALQFALEAHGDQKHGGRPFGCHLLDVAREVTYWKGEERFPGITIASFLHDADEDTKATRGQIGTLFGADVEAWVWAVTDSTEGENREERKANTYVKTRAEEGGVFLKLCDRMANVKQCLVDSPRFLAMYRKEQPGFRAALYREGEFEDMWAMLDELLASEPTQQVTRFVHQGDPLVFRQMGAAVNIMHPLGHVHLLYEPAVRDDAEVDEYLDRLLSIREAVCGVSLGEGAGPMRLSAMATPSAVGDGIVIGTHVSCPDCLGFLES